MTGSTHGFTPMQKLILTAVGVSITGYIFFKITNLLLPFFISFILAYLLGPLIDRMEFLFKKRILAVSVLYVVFFSISAFLIWLTVPIVTKEIHTLSKLFPTYISQGKQLYQTTTKSLNERFPLMAQIHVDEKIEAKASEYTRELIKEAPAIAIQVLSIFSTLSLVPFILFFFLIQGPDMFKRAVTFIPNRYFETSIHLLYKISTQLGNYLRGILIEAGVVGGLSAGFLLLIGVDYALIIASVAGLCNLIPYLGPISGAIPAVIVFYMKMKTINSVFLIIGTFALIQFIDNMLVQPMIYSQSIDLHPLLILLAALIGGSFGGIWGLVVAVPLAGILKVIVTQFYAEIMFRHQRKLETSSH